MMETIYLAYLPWRSVLYRIDSNDDGDGVDG